MSYGWTRMLDERGFETMKRCVSAILDELAAADFAWHEYPTLIDAIEQHVEAALVTPNQQAWITTAALIGAPPSGPLAP